MKTNGLFNAAHGLEKQGFRAPAAVYYNLTEAELYEEAIDRRRAQLVETYGIEFVRKLEAKAARRSRR